jgi:DNA-binding beta-propeller fold protein YncE
MNVRTTLLAALSVFSLSPAAPAWDRGEATTFARLPSPTRNPEGIALDRNTGDVYVADFDVFRQSGVGQVIVFNREGKLLRVVNVKSSSPALLGLDFHPDTHALLVIDFGNQRVLDVDPRTGDSTVFATVDSPAGASGLNALTFDRPSGNVYISDSFRGIVWKTSSRGGAAARWVEDDKLKPQGVPPFGANGLAFNRAQDALFVANTANDTIVRVAVKNGAAGKVEVFTNSINGADGLAIDEQDNIWVCANQSDEIVVVDKTGKAIAKLGDFDGIGERGEPRGFLFPASLVFSGEFVLVTNLSLDTTGFGFQTVDTQWTRQVKTHTVAKIKRRLPPVHDD